MSNTITVTGKLSKDGELKYSQSGKAMLRLSVPDQKRRLNQQSQEWENASDTTWFTATVFEQTAEELSEQAVKGAPISITGRLITRNYTTNNGEQRTSLEIDQPTVVIGKPRQNNQGGFGGNSGRNYDATSGQGGWNQPPSNDPWATGGQTQQGGFSDEIPF